MSNNTKLTIVFYVNGMDFDGDALTKQSLGGSETAGLCMARELAARGHDVTMFCNTKNPGRYGNVNYIPIESFMPYMTYTATDVLIAQRVPQVFANTMKSKINILWQHDIALKRFRQDFRGGLWNVDEVWGLSDFHIKQMSETHIVPKELFWKTRNGIDKINLKPQKRHPKRLIYTARPERGLAVLLGAVMPKIWEQDREVELFLAGYDNTVNEMKPFYDSLNARITELQKQGFIINSLGPLNKKDLYKHYQKASLYAYPTEFEEISCITAMECMACGLPMVTTALAALPETLAEGAAIQLEGDYKTEQFQDEFVGQVLRLLSDKGRLNAMRKAGIEAADKLLWSDLAGEWEDHFYELFEQRTKNKETLARHFYRNEDIAALKHLNISGWNKRIESEYPILTSQEAYDEMYNAQGKEVPIPAELNNYARVKVAIEAFKAADFTCLSPPLQILDFGGGIGNEAIQFVNELKMPVTTVDISEEQQDKGWQFAAEKCKDPSAITWVTEQDPANIEGNFAAVFAGEILEHQVEPWKLVDALEAKCLEGGTMVFTVPFGPWGDTAIELDFRGHVWNFDKSDLREMFGRKKGLSIKMVAGPVNKHNGEVLGWYVISYTSNKSITTGKIKLDRKVAIQAPRQTLSTCMIIGGNQEGLLYRCLDSIVTISDEVIICDTGMSQACSDILYDKKYDDKLTVIYNAPNPLQVGFDEARNAGLKHATSDWILWVDSDEELLTPQKIYKYLRYNIYGGYSIRQHHFSAQPPNAFPPDVPIRLFRNNKGIKFFGVVHEHPERGINEGVGESTILSDTDIAHDGYLTEDGRRKKFDRNFELLLADRQKHPERKLGKFLIMRDWILLSRYALEKNGGQITPEIEQHCNAVIKMYREEFLGKNQLMSADGLQFYSEALGILNRGLEYIFNLNAHPQKAQIARKDMTARFETKEDFMAYMMAHLNEVQEPFDGRYI